MFRYEKENPYDEMRKQLGLVMDRPPEPPRFRISSLFPKAEDTPSAADQFGLPPITPPMSLAEAREQRNREAVDGLCVEENDDE